MSETMITAVVLSAVMMISGVVLIWMARAAASGRLKRNQLAGIRTQKTMASEEAWRAAHVRAKTPTIAAAVVSLVVGAALLLPMGTTPMITIVAVASAVIFGLVAYGAVIGGRAADAVTHGTDEVTGGAGAAQAPGA